MTCSAREALIMAQTSFGPRKFVLDMGSLSHQGLFIAPGQEANWDNWRLLEEFPRDSKTSLNSHGKQAISVRVFEGLLFKIF